MRLGAALAFMLGAKASHDGDILPHMPEQAAIRRYLEQGQLEEALDALSAQLPGQPGSATRKNIISGIRLYLRWVQEHDKAVLHPEAAEYSEWLTATAKPATAKNRMSQVRHLYDLLCELGLVEENPFRGLTGPLNRPHEHRDVYTTEEIGRLLQAAKEEERALILLGAHGGLTGPEVMHLDFAQLPDYREIVLPDRKVPCTPELIQALTRWAEVRGQRPLFEQSGPVFDMRNDYHLREKVFKLCVRSEVPYRAWQPLRNAAGLKMIQEYGSDQAMLLLGLSAGESLRPLERLLDGEEPTE